MRSSLDPLTSSRSNLAVCFLAFPYPATVPAYGHLIATDRLSANPQRTESPARGFTKAVRLAEVRYRTGLVNYLDVLDAQRTALAAETQLVLTERTRLTDMVGLFKALGGGWAPSPTRDPT